MLRHLPGLQAVPRIFSYPTDQWCVLVRGLFFDRDVQEAGGSLGQPSDERVADPMVLEKRRQAGISGSDCGLDCFSSHAVDYPHSDLFRRYRSGAVLFKSDSGLSFDLGDSDCQLHIWHMELNRLKGPGVEEFLSQAEPPWKGQKKGF